MNNVGGTNEGISIEDWLLLAGLFHESCRCRLRIYLVIGN